jgi:hypothetical protein
MTADDRSVGVDIPPHRRDNPRMAIDAPTPLPLRPSTADRERVARLLRDRSAEGRLSLDTFSERVERVFGARSEGELEELVADVRRPRGLRRLLVRVTEWLSGLDADLEAAWDRPRVEVVALPAAGAGVRMTLGRARECDWVLAEDTVSRRHAELRHDGRRWLLRDLGSRNGTRVNGMHLLGETEVRPGDRIGLGAASYRLASSRGA